MNGVNPPVDWNYHQSASEFWRSERVDLKSDNRSASPQAQRVVWPCAGERSRRGSFSDRQNAPDLPEFDRFPAGSRDLESLSRVARENMAAQEVLNRTMVIQDPDVGGFLGIERQFRAGKGGFQKIGPLKGLRTRETDCG